MHFPHRIGAGVLAGTILLAGAGSALAATGTTAKAHNGFVVGQVSNVSTTGFTVTRTTKATATTPATTRTVAVTLAPAAKERATKGTTGALANGEFALVVGQRTATAITAQRIVYSTTLKSVRRAARLLARSAVGTINTASATTVTITTKRGVTRTFSLTPTTKYRVNKVVSTTMPAFVSGQKVRVVFKLDKTTKTLVALRVAIPVAK